MRKLLVSLPDEVHEALREIAFRHRTSMSELVRSATEQVYEDEIDSIELEKGLDEYLADPSSAISLDDYIAKRRGAVQRSA